MKPSILTRYMILVFFFVFACQKSGVTDSNDNDTTPQVITLDGQEGRQYEVLDILIPDASFTEESYPLTIEGNDYEIFTVNQNTLVFLVPELSIGSYPAEFQVGSVIYEFSLKIAESLEINNAEQYFDDFIQLIQSDSEFQAGQEFDQAVEQFYELSDQEKQVAVTFIAHNNALLENLVQELDGLDPQMVAKLQAQACQWQCYLIQGTKVVLTGAAIASAASSTPVLGLAAATIAGIDVGLSIITGKRSYLISKAKTVVKNALNFTVAPQVEYYNLIMDDAMLKLNMGKDSQNKVASSTESLEVIADKKYSLTVSDIPFRTLNAEDADGPNSILSSFANAYNIFRSLAHDYLDIELPNYNNNSEQLPIERLSQITFSTQSNLVKISEQTVGSDKITLVFDFIDEETTDPESFTLDLMYEHEDYKFEHSFTLTLERQDLPDFIGLWGWQQGGDEGGMSFESIVGDEVIGGTGYEIYMTYDGYDYENSYLTCDAVDFTLNKLPEDGYVYESNNFFDEDWARLEFTRVNRDKYILTIIGDEEVASVELNRLSSLPALCQ